MDNIIASYPPMTIRLNRYGEDYDANLKGAAVLGCMGDFNVPFLANGASDIFVKACFSYVTNFAGATQTIKVNAPQLHYRWRYLNQIVGEWNTIPFSPSSCAYLTDSTATQLVTSASVPLDRGVGDLEYFFTANLDSQYYLVRDYANDTAVGFGSEWTEKITAVTNRATYVATDGLPSGGTDYFVRIREGESNIEWVELQGTLTVTNKVAGSNEVVRLLTENGTVPRMTLVGDHSWRYHYAVPTNAIGGKLTFHLVTKEYYTNATDATVWLVRTNTLYTVEDTVTEIPYPATLDPGNPNDISVILDDASTHLKIEYNDEQRAFSLSHAAYQTFNLWTDAQDGFRGNVMETNGNAVVSNSGVSGDKRRYDAPFNTDWRLCPEQNNFWLESFTPPVETNQSESTEYPLDKWFSVGKTPNGWTAHNSRFVEGARGDNSNLALALDGSGEGAIAMDNFPEEQLPLGLDTVQFTARIAQPIQFEDFATYQDGFSCKNYAISAKVTMSQLYETTTVKPTDMSPIYPSVSFVGYHRGKQGCYEFRMTRNTDTSLLLQLYKWTKSGSTTKPTLLTSKDYSTNLLVPSTSEQASGSYWTSAYFLVYTMSDGRVKLEGHMANSRTQNTVKNDGAAVAASAIAYVDEDPGVFANGGSYGVGATDCRAGFGQIALHNVERPPSAVVTTSGDAVINYTGVMEGVDKIRDEWDYYDSRWELDTVSRYKNDGGLIAVIPSNQVIEVWLSDATIAGGGWDFAGYSTNVNSFSTNKFVISPHMPGTWKVRLQTGEEEDAGVVVDDVEITPWEGENIWVRGGSPYSYSDDWVYTKAWIAATANLTRNTKDYYLSDSQVKPAGTNGYVMIFSEPGAYTIQPTVDMQLDRFLVVGGGGAGGDTLGGGGGGGAVLDKTMDVVLEAGKIYTFAVGAGGKVVGPLSTSASPWNAGGDGGESSITINGTKYRSKGGGGGASWSTRSGRAGGSGGGASDGNNNGTNGSGGAGTTGSATEGQGFKGGNNYGDRAGGGGGAGAPGQDANASDDKAGDGGDGLASDITGQIEYYGGGGGGGGGDGDKAPNSTNGGAGGLGGGASGQGKGTQVMAAAGEDGRGGGGAGGAYNGAVGTNRGGAGGSGVVILRVRTASIACTLQPSRGVADKPMGLRSPYLDKGMSLFTYSYANADSNCVLLVQIATNMSPSVENSYVSGLTTSLATNNNDQVWTTVARHDFSTKTNKDELVSGTMTTFISLRQHWIYDIGEGKTVYTNVCGLIRVIVDPDIVSKVVNAPPSERDSLVDYGKITLTRAYCWNEPVLNQRSWFGWNVHTEGWDGTGGAGRFAYLTDWPDGLSLALNFSANQLDNDVTDPDTLGIGLGEPDKATEYAGQNPFIQSATLTNGIGTVSFRARLFDTNATGGRAVVTLYGSPNPGADQPSTEDMEWHILTNFVVTTPTYQSFEWAQKASMSEIRAVRLEAAGARWGRYPAAKAHPWEWEYLDVKQSPVNRVCLDEVSVSELIVPRLKFLDVRPFRTNLGTEDICVITNIMSADQQPLYRESWGIQCRVEPQQMADELDTSSVTVWMEVYRGSTPWGYEQWKDLDKDGEAYINGEKVTIQRRFTSELQRVSDSNLVFRSYYLLPESIIPPEEEPGTVYQYVLFASYCDKAGNRIDPPTQLEAVDWKVPEWYRGSNVGAGNESGDSSQFSAFTILDSISPRRAWINELNLCDAPPLTLVGKNQFIELAVPQGADLTRWSIRYIGYNGREANSLGTFGIDTGMKTVTIDDKVYGTGATNSYTFVSICSPMAKDNVPHDGIWKDGKPSKDGYFDVTAPYGIQLVRPSNIIEHEIVVQGTNQWPNSTWGSSSSGTNLLAALLRSDPGSQWFYAGEDLAADNTTLGVFRSHGENVDPSCWTNYMVSTPGEINRLKDGTLQVIPKGYFLEPRGGNVWIYSTLLNPECMTQSFGGRQLGANATIVVQTNTVTNIVFTVTNWYQIGSCKINEVEVPGASGQRGRYVLNLPASSQTREIKIKAVPDDELKTDWGLTANNSYSDAVFAWLKDKYMDYKPSDLSQAIYSDLSGVSRIPLTLTEMYWLDIPPVHAPPHYGGSNICFKAGSGSLVSGDEPAVVEPHVVVRPDGSLLSNVYMTVTMMITNTSPLANRKAWSPDHLNGHVYIDGGSTVWEGPWTSAVFMVTGALQKPGATSSDFKPLCQYVFQPGSFGAPDSEHPFQTRIEVMNPYTTSTMGNYLGWPEFNGLYPVLYRWVIRGSPDNRMSPVPLKSRWASP